MEKVVIGNYSIALEKGNDEVPDLKKILTGQTPCGDRLIITNIETGHSEIYNPPLTFSYSGKFSKGE